MSQVKTVLITGGAGFVATHLARHLLAQGYRVRSLDIKEPDYKVKGVTYTRGDARNKTLLTKSVRGVSAVFHLAAITSIPACQDQPHESYRTNVMLTCDVLEAVRLESIRSKKAVRFIYSSSCAVYGNIAKEGTGLSEDLNLTTPVSFFGAQKLASEHAIRLYVKQHGLHAVVLRIFNLYGHGQAPLSANSDVITIFQNHITKNEPLGLNGGGNQTRDFIAVEDVARACGLALKAPDLSCNGEPINIGSSIAINIKSLAEIMLSNARRHCPQKKTPARLGDVLHSKADISKAKQILKWIPHINLHDGLKNLMKH